jgi:hypothetical protein
LPNHTDILPTGSSRFRYHFVEVVIGEFHCRIEATRSIHLGQHRLTELERCYASLCGDLAYSGEQLSIACRLNKQLFADEVHLHECQMNESLTDWNEWL